MFFFIFIVKYKKIYKKKKKGEFEAKLILNSSYGKFGMESVQTMSKIILNSTKDKKKEISNKLASIGPSVCLINEKVTVANPLVVLTIFTGSAPAIFK